MVERFGTMGIYVHFSAYDEVAAELYRVRNAIVTITAERDDCEASARGASLAYGEQRERATAAEAKLAKVEAERDALARKVEAFRNDGLVQAAIARQGALQEERDDAVSDRDRLSAELAEARKRAEKLHRRAQSAERASQALQSSMALWGEMANDRKCSQDQFNYGMRFAIREIRLDVERAIRRLASKEASHAE